MSRPKDENREDTVVRSIRMKVSLAKKIEELANSQNRNFSNMAETLLIKQLEK